MTTATRIEISDANLARRFCKAIAAKGVLRGSAFWSDEKWFGLTRRYLDTMPAADAARTLATLKAKPKAYNIRGAVCRRCGAALSNPESVAVGLGPECQQEG